MLLLILSGREKSALERPRPITTMTLYFLICSQVSAGPSRPGHPREVHREPVFLQVGGQFMAAVPPGEPNGRLSFRRGRFPPIGAARYCNQCDSDRCQGFKIRLDLHVVLLG